MIRYYGFQTSNKFVFILLLHKYILDRFVSRLKLNDHFVQDHHYASLMTLLICIQPITKDLNQHHKVCDPGNGQIYACIDTWSLAVRVLVYHCLYWYINACVDSRPIDFLHNEILPVLHVMF